MRGIHYFCNLLALEPSFSCILSMSSSSSQAPIIPLSPVILDENGLDLLVTADLLFCFLDQAAKVESDRLAPDSVSPWKKGLCMPESGSIGPVHPMTPNTTVRVKFVPRNYCLKTFMKEIDYIMFRLIKTRSYDFIYLPREVTHTRLRGHAFINMKTPELPIALIERLCGRPWFRSESKRPAGVAWADEQGLRDCIVRVNSTESARRKAVNGVTLYIEPHNLHYVESGIVPPIDLLRINFHESHIYRN